MKMKISAKPISSPNRTDKFPTPLMMRFLRSNVGSRSRGSRSSRSSPIFIMRTKKNAAAVINNDAQQEPSSPKVTCIGQVRARRSSSKAKKSKSKRPSRSTTPSKHPCSCSPVCSCCVPRSHFCCCQCSIPRFRKPRSFCRLFCKKWVTFFSFGYCRKVDSTRDDCSSRVEESIPRGQKHVNSATSNASSDVEENGGEKQEDFVESFSSSPPKNALLLTRCRSAPYRSSSLAGRFWGSPLRTSETETEKEKSPKKEVQEPQEGEMEMPKSPNNCGTEAVESRNSCNHESEELESSSNIQANNNTSNIHPLILTRCKSEPARSGERLNPEVNLIWRQRRSDTTESCLREKLVVIVD
ncbi:hypothetical protein ACH5RR_005433 [Cinchona calisaya]|uniref:Uncharacterized protein n=1 Tax=Cinchona calisaya TaxID=153742 RepID=A0ABD3AL81_9GENT